MYVFSLPVEFNRICKTSITGLGKTFRIVLFVSCSLFSMLTVWQSGVSQPKLSTQKIQSL